MPSHKESSSSSLRASSARVYPSCARRRASTAPSPSEAPMMIPHRRGFSGVPVAGLSESDKLSSRLNGCILTYPRSPAIFIPQYLNCPKSLVTMGDLRGCNAYVIITGIRVVIMAVLKNHDWLRKDTLRFYPGYSSAVLRNKKNG